MRHLARGPSHTTPTRFVEPRPLRFPYRPPKSWQFWSAAQMGTAPRLMLGRLGPQLRGFLRAKHWSWGDTSALSSVASPREHRMHKLCSIGLPGPVRPGLANWLSPELWPALRSKCLETRCGLRAASPSRGVLVDFRAEIWLPPVPEFYSLI